MIDLAVKNVYLRTINLGFLERIRIGIVFDLFVYIFHGARNWVKTCRPAFLTSDSREMAFTPRIFLVRPHFGAMYACSEFQGV